MRRATQRSATASAETVRRRSTAQVWSPNLEVWVPRPDGNGVGPASGELQQQQSGGRLGSLQLRVKRRGDAALADASPVTEGPNNATAESRGEGGGGSPASPAREKRPPRPSTKKNKRPKLSVNESPRARDSDVEIQESDKEPPETCPICLSDIVDLKEKAVVKSCMHVFCLPCLTRWVRQKRVCPMCKGRVEGYMYDIYSEAQYQERIMSPSPPPSPRRTAASHLFGAGGGETSWLDVLTAIHRADVALSAAGFEPVGRGAGGGRWRETRAASAVRRYRARTSSSRWDQPERPREPRPYYFRVQQHAHSAAPPARVPPTHPGERPVPRTTPQDERQLWRQHIYEADVWAMMSGRQQPTVHGRTRIQQWLDRELRALLLQEDVSLVRAVVMGLLESYGLPELHPSATATAAIRASLGPFLQDSLEHFWHELRCFASSTVALLTYDRIVEYYRTQNNQNASNRVPDSEFTLWSAQHRNPDPDPPRPPRLPAPRLVETIDLTLSPARFSDNDDELIFIRGDASPDEVATSRLRNPAPSRPAAPRRASGLSAALPGSARGLRHAAPLRERDSSRRAAGVSAARSGRRRLVRSPSRSASPEVVQRARTPPAANSVVGDFPATRGNASAAGVPLRRECPGPSTMVSAAAALPPADSAGQTGGRVEASAVQEAMRNAGDTSVVGGRRLSQVPAWALPHPFMADAGSATPLNPGTDPSSQPPLPAPWAAPPGSAASNSAAHESASPPETATVRFRLEGRPRAGPASSSPGGLPRHRSELAPLPHGRDSPQATAVRRAAHPHAAPARGRSREGPDIRDSPQATAARRPAPPPAASARGKFRDAVSARKPAREATSGRRPDPDSEMLRERLVRRMARAREQLRDAREGAGESRRGASLQSGPEGDGRVGVRPNEQGPGSPTVPVREIPALAQERLRALLGEARA